MTPGTPIKIFVVEDEALLRELLANLLASIEDFELVGTAGDGDSALAAMKIRRPDVVLMDLHLGDGPNGIQIGLKAQEDNSQLAIIVLTSVPQTLDAASVILDGGARWSYLSKKTLLGISALERTIRSAAEGMSVFDPTIVEVARRDTPAGISQMTGQQIEVLSYLAQGYSSEGVGLNLGITTRTVDYHLQEIYNRLENTREPDMNPRVHAALWFARQATLSAGDSAMPDSSGARRPGPR